MHVRIRHETRYAYDGPAAIGPHLVRLHPARHTRTRVLTYDLEVRPAPEVRWQEDPWGNRLARVTYPSGRLVEELVISVEAVLDVRPVNPFDFFVDDRCERVPFAYPDGLAGELAPFLAPRAPGRRLAAWLADVPAEGPTTDVLVALNRRAAETVRYLIRDEPGIQTSEETLEKGSGSCRDIALLLADALRARGLAARFVSGYLVQLADEGNIPGERRGVAKDVVDLHAWAEAYVPGAGWVGLDGTSGLLCGEGHIPLASAVHPELAAPVTGTSSRAASRFEVRMEVERLREAPRPRRPYTDEQWAALVAAGREVDARLLARGLRLTMGGEPTWTSREHPRAPEWNQEALGPTKLAQGLRLASELRRRLGSGALVLERPGKWYPGESLPRWALEMIWRADGTPLWRDPARLELRAPSEAEPPREERAALLDAARALGLAIARRLGVEARLHEAYEDPWVHIAEEANLPEGIDPHASDLDDPEERRRLARVLGRGLGSPVGFALPLARGDERWRSGAWSFRRGRLHLVPGDSPIGLRLPLARIAGAPPEEPADASAPQPPFAFDPRQPRRSVADARTSAPPTISEQRADAGPGAGLPPRTALCVEPRGGRLHVFLPPLRSAEDFLELCAAVEDAAAERAAAVRLEGYPPPPDPRLRSLKVTPDPGVIEVNVPPTERFEEYVALLGTLSDAANHAGLTTEKFQLDGREVGSGGGNHITLGGPSAAESPFLVRPDILASLLRFLQNHPSLSYLFTGLFVGPTSQAPRPDEARHDALHELELALARAAEPRAHTPPWLADRLLRDLLADVSGNTHRTEVSIDKLWDPAGPAGRLGIIELRAFEMPPHERMAAAQMLLARALVARFADEPYERPLVRWGRELHDRFLLPHYIGADIRDVARDLRAHGLPIDDAFFRPFLEYRFPLLGSIEAEGVRLELRPALEPWPVLGEEPTGATVSRYVDSSLDRVEVTLEGAVPGRHRVAVNGIALPMRPAGTAGARVAGVRFRAWRPPRCLQPTVGIHHPLRFDIVDTWARRSLGAATYHVWHPEGRAYDEPPLTAFEAAARRAQRFTTLGHTPYPVELLPAEPDPEAPVTLDLRRFPIDRPPP